MLVKNHKINVAFFGNLFFYSFFSKNKYGKIEL